MSTSNYIVLSSLNFQDMAYLSKLLPSREGGHILDKSNPIVSRRTGRSQTIGYGE
jgi:hypothetical protein